MHCKKVASPESPKRSELYSWRIWYITPLHAFSCNSTLSYDQLQGTIIYLLASIVLRHANRKSFSSAVLMC
jgi:hypothetical protein